MTGGNYIGYREGQVGVARRCAYCALLRSSSIHHSPPLADRKNRGRRGNMARIIDSVAADTSMISQFRMKSRRGALDYAHLGATQPPG
jgi:hypothetical protein